MKRYIHASNEQDKLRKVGDLAEEIVNYLDDNGISRVELYNYKIYQPIDRIAVIDVYIDGDWKHDHLRADWLVKEKYHPVRSDSVPLEDTGSDWGPELHTYYIYMSELSEV